MTYHDLSPELQEKVRANTIAEEVRNGKTMRDAKRYLNECIEENNKLSVFFIFRYSPEGKDYWWDVMEGKIK